MFAISILHPAGFNHNPALYCFRPTLPPAKQANRNLILKAISEAQDSITKTTAFPSSTHIYPHVTIRITAFVIATLSHLWFSHSAAEADGSRCTSYPFGQQRRDECSHPAGAGAPPRPGPKGSGLPFNRATSFWSTWCVNVHVWTKISGKVGVLGWGDCNSVVEKLTFCLFFVFFFNMPVKRPVIQI